VKARVPVATSHPITPAERTASLTAGQLLRRLEKYEILPPPVLEELQRALAGRENIDGRAFAERLVAGRRLTRWQAERILTNRPVVLGSYKLLDRIGAGGMGVVLKAEQWDPQRVVALKVLSVAQLKRPDAIRRFDREIEAARSLDHPNIVRVVDFDCLHGTPFLAMEYVEGRNLSDIVRQHGPLPIRWACEIARQTAVGLQHAHEEGLVHRDIKPSNLLLTLDGSDEESPRRGGGEQQGRHGPTTPAQPLVKILDFGMARFTSEAPPSEELTRTDQVFGTIDFIAPEQAQSSRSADIRADLYSLGCTLFYLLTGKPPFPGITALEKLQARVDGRMLPLRELRPEIPAGLQKIVNRMLASDRDRRYQKPYEAAEALSPFASAPWPEEIAAFLDKGPDDDHELSPSEMALEQFLGRITAAAPSGSSRVLRPGWRRRHWWLAAAAAAAVAAGLLAITWGLFAS
jgi:serine/threonine-protein kinase